MHVDAHRHLRAAGLWASEARSLAIHMIDGSHEECVQREREREMPDHSPIESSRCAEAPCGRSANGSHVRSGADRRNEWVV
jgi:hypothetical protein